jgi:hypothetical protein
MELQASRDLRHYRITPDLYKPQVFLVFGMDNSLSFLFEMFPAILKIDFGSTTATGQTGCYSCCTV